MAHRLVVGVFLCLLSLVSAASRAQTVAFVDAQGAPASTLVDGDTVRVRVTDPGADTGPGRDSAAVSVVSGRAGDSAALTLLETGPHTGVFEGEVRLDAGGSPSGSGLATASTPGPPPTRDSLQVTYPANGATASASLVGSVLRFIDAWGGESATFAAGDLVRLRVRDEMRNDHRMLDSFVVTVTSQSTGDSETMLVEETGKSTGVFEGTLFTVRGGAATSSDGVLRVASPDTVTAALAALDGVTTASAQTERANGLVRLLNADGEPVDAYLEGENVRVAVIDPFTSSDTVSVQVTTAVTGDSETLVLSRVLGALYEGEIPTRMIYFSSSMPGDGLLQITETYIPELDAVTVTHGSGASASAGFLPGRIAFVDDRGEVTSSYATGTEVHVRLEAPSRNTPARDQLLVELTNQTWGLSQALNLVETSRDSGVFVGSIPMTGSGHEPPTFSVDPGNQIRVRYSYVVAELGAEAFAEISSRALWFLDERGEPTGEVVESGPARVRMYSPDDNASAGSADAATVEMRGRLSGDLEPLTLTETGPDTDVFEGAIPLEMSSLGEPDGMLQTANTGPPDYRQDEVTARSGPVEATARTIGARIRFLDVFGRETTSYTVGETVRLRVIDHFWTLYGDSIQVTLAEIGGHGDVETVTLQETGPTTGVFEATFPTSPTGPAAADGILSLVGAEQIEVRHVTSFSPIEITARAAVRMSSVLFVDAAGQPAEVYLESTRAYLRVRSAADNFSPSSAQTVVVQLLAELSGDTEMVTLTETGPDTGVFQGSIQTRLSSSASGSNGTLETTQEGGGSAPHEFDTLRATFQGALGDPAVARIGLTGSRTWFTNAAGAEVLDYPIGGRAYIRVEDHSASSTPGVINSVTVQVRSAVTADLQPLDLLETGLDTGIFTGSLPLLPGWATGGDSALQVQPGDLIEVWHEDLNGVTASSAAARILASSLEIIDEQGEPTDTLLQGDEVRVRVFSHSGNSNPAQTESVTIQLQSLYGADTQTLALTETGPNTSVFEGAMELYTSYSSTPAVGLRTSYGPFPYNLEDRVTASLGPVSDEARVTGLRIAFFDAFGRETATYAVGETVRVRVEDHMRNSNPTSQDSAHLDVSSSTGDRESLGLQETGFDTSIFEGTLPTVLSGGGLHNGQLLVAGGGTVAAEIYPYGGNGFLTKQASITGNAVRFVDAAGQPATEYLEGSRAFLRVISAASNTSDASAQTLTVELSSDLVEDTELVTLTETGPGTAVFEGSIPLRLQNAAFLNDGSLQTYEESGPPHRFDTIRATFQDPQGTSAAQIGLTGSRTWFVDAAGNETLSYPAGGTARIRVEAPSRNNAWQYDFTDVQVRSLVNNDVEVVRLQETARDSGVFTGSLPMATEYDAVAIEGLLRVQAGEQIEALHEDVLGFTASSAVADIEDRSIEILDDETGLSGVLLEKGRARVRVFSVFDNANPGQAESVVVQVSSQLGSDVETLTLTETGPDTDLFEGTLPLDNDFNGNPAGSLRTSYGPYPENQPDRVTASYGPVSAQARVVGASLVFLDADGRETATYAAGESVRVRVVDHNRNSSTTSIDTAYIDLSASTGDNESIQLQETGYNTSVFEGSMPTVLTGGATFNNQLLVAPGGSVEARIYPYSANGFITRRAAITGNAVRFVDAAGRPASSYLESSRAYLQVTSITRNTSASTVETVTAQLNTELGTDNELVTLTETGANTGIFRGSIRLRLASSVSPGDGVLQTHQVGGPPHEYDTLRATYSDPSGTSVARIGQTGSRVWFVDATGAEVASYPVGGTVRVRVEDQNRNTPGQWDFLPVRVRSLITQDEETVQLQETSRDSGVFAGSLPLAATGPQGAGDGRLLAQAGERIEAIHDEVILESKATAVIEDLAIQFIDAAGEPTGTLLEKGTVWVRVFSVFASSSVSIELRSVYGSDIETLTLTETGAGTHVFEGTLPLDTDFNTNQTGSLRTSYGPYPEKLEDRVTASFGPISSSARVVGSSILLFDGYGRETTAFAAGETVRVRVVDHNRNANTTSFDMVYIDLSSSTGDNESLELQETGYNTSVFEGTIPTSLSGGATFNGQLLVAPGGSVEARVYPYAANGPIAVRAAITGNAVRFVDAAGQPASSYLESSRAYLQVTSATRNTSASTVQTVTVQLNNELGSDSDLVTLTETGANTGVFRGSIALRLATSASPGDGILQTHQISGPPHEYDTLRATYSDPSGTSVARIGLTGSRVWFVDATGAEVSTYPVGGTVRVRVEDQNRNTPGQWDFIPVRVRSLTTQDEEVVQLQETSRDSGVFGGSLPLTAAGPQGTGDGRLLAQAGERIVALYDEVILQSKATASIEDLAIQFVDAAGEPTGTLIEKGTARVRVFSVFNSSSLTVELRSVYGSDIETLTLTETGAGTHVFEGTLPLDTDFNTNQSGSLRTSYGPYPEKLEDRVTASFGPISAEARVVGSSIVFLDGYGRETTAYAVGETVRVRVVDNNRNSSTTSFDTTYIDLSSSTGDNESLEVRETGYNTSVFEGTIPATISGGATFNGQLLVAPGGSVEARVYPYAANGFITTRAAITGNAVRFVNAAGQPAFSYLESSRAYLEVTSATRNISSITVQTVTVQLNTELGADTELVTLTETGANTGVFRGSIALRLVSSAASPGDGVLQTYQISGPPHEYDTLRATYTDPSGTSVARIGLTGSRVWFVDATGAEVTSYPVGGTVRVRVEDQNRNTPGQWDFVPARVRSLTTQDEEIVQLQETSRDSGVFAGSLPLAATGPQGTGDGRLLAQAGERIEALYDEVILQSKATASIDDLAIWFIDAAGEPTTTLIEKGTARIRAFSVSASSSLTVELRSVYGSDFETLTLTETGAGTHVFEGTLPLDNDFNGNLSGSLRTTYGPYPESLEDRVTASFGPVSTEARVVGSSIVFLDAYGRETTAYAAGEPVRVRLVDHNRNFETSTVDTAFVDLSSSTGDSESLELQETGENTSVFEGTMPTVLSGGATFNGQLRVAPGGTVDARVYPYGANGFIAVQAAITGNAVRFVDASGQPASSYLESSRAYLQVTSATRNTSASTVQTLTVQLSNELGADSEVVTLTETGANTGVFRGSIALRLVFSAANPGDGVLQTYQVSGPPHEFDTLRATYTDPSGTSVARIGLTGSRTWFTDSQGTEALSFPANALAYVRVEDHNFDTPGVIDQIPARVRSLTAQDEEAIQLTETGTDTGIFIGSLRLSGPPASLGDGRLLVQPGEQIEAEHEDAGGYTTSSAIADVTTQVNQAPEPTADTAATPEDEPVTVSVLGNDTDPDADPLDVVSITQPALGAAVLNANDSITYTPPANTSGEAVFSYTVRDPNGLEATASVTITITSVNDAPIANNDMATVVEDGSVSIAVLTNDSDPDDDALDVTAVTQGAHGTVTIEADNTLTYEPAANYHGADSFTYTISDGTGGSGGTALAVVSLTITPVNDDPVAADDQASGSEDGTITIAVLGNDSDADDDPLTVASVTQGSNGSVAVQADQTVIYTPVANFHGTDSFTYTIEDGNGGTATATVTVSIGSENDSPVAVADSASVAEDNPVVVSVLSNDTDPENDTLDVLSVTLGANGSAVINADETVTYTPDANFHGTDSFTYTIGDGNGGTATATVTVTVTSVNDTPVVNDDAASVAEDGSVSVAVLTNDDDADDDPLTLTAVTQGANGSAAIDGQQVIYTPNANFNGTDSFTYTVSDGQGGMATASVAVTVNSGNAGPVATPDTATVTEDGAVTVTVLANDSDPENDPLQVTSVTQGADGTVVINGGATVTYTPDPSFHGTDSFTYTIEDGNGGTATTTVTVTVTPVNDVPVANADAGSVAEDGSVAIAVLTNDDDADGDTLNVTAVTQGANGSATVNPNKTITYTPNPNFQGSDVFTYTVSDGKGGTATASVAITVTAVNDAPVANPNTATTPEDTPVVVAVLANDTDADGDTLQVASVTQGTKGAVTINPDRTVTYTPNANVSGSDSFTYTVSDGNGGTATAAVTLTITAVNDAPVAVNDTATTTAEVLVNVTVLGNDVDVDSPSLTVTSVTQPAHGTTLINADKTIRYTPASGYKGSDAYTYTISDGAGGTATATVSVTVNAPPRVTGNLQVLYDFNEGSGSTVTDTSGTGTPLNLTVANPGAVSWLTGGLSVNSATLIQSAGAATKVISACQTSNAITIEAWVAPDNTSQTGPAPLVSISQASNKRNVTFGQSANRWDGRLRTSSTNQAGNTVQTAAGTVSTALSHVVYTRDSAGNIRIYVNGVQSTSSTLAGNFSSWTTSYKLGLVNELSTGSPWLGDLYLVAIYSRVLSATEVRQNWLAGE